MAFTMAELNSDRALVGYQDRHSELGPGTWYYVLMADGFLLDCGTGKSAPDRAKHIASAINAALDLANKKGTGDA